MLLPQLQHCRRCQGIALQQSVCSLVLLLGWGAQGWGCQGFGCCGPWQRGHVRWCRVPLGCCCCCHLHMPSYKTFNT